MENKKEAFKLLIKHFHESRPPHIIRRDFRWPSSCRAVSSESFLNPLPVLPGPSSIIAITGPRRCGKTYLVHQLIDDFCSRSAPPVNRNRLIYINFEDERILPLSLADVSALSDAYFELYPDNRDKEVILFLDEIHHVEGWESFLRILLDQKNLRVFITTSSSEFCPTSLSSALSCQTLEVAISPLSFGEFLVFKGLDFGGDLADSSIRFKIINLLEEYLTYGGYPEVVLTDLPSKLQILRNYYDISVYRDLVQQFGVRNIDLLKGLIKYLVSHVGSNFTVNSYFLYARRNWRISRETVLDYVSFLERKGLISLVPIYSKYAKVQQVNPKKVYSSDNGIRNAVSFPIPQQDERLAKNVVFQMLARHGAEVFYWKSRREVDFVARKNGKLMGINVSYGRELGDREILSLLEFQSAVGKHNADVTIVTKDTEQTDRGIRFCPLWKWLLTSDRHWASDVPGRAASL